MSRSTSRSRTPRLVVGGLLLLDLLSGCGAAEAGEPSSGSPSPPASVRTAPTPTPTGRPTAPATTAPPPLVPAVQEYRATLPPVVNPRPAPTRFRAASIEVDLPVVPTGVADDGRMQLPETNREVAWYAYGSRPGDDSGTTVMAAHIDTRTEGLGPFSRLRGLRRGAGIEVTVAGGATQHYTVTDVTDVAKSDIALDQLFRRDGPAELKVLTCGGTYSRQTGYHNNIMVTAHPG